MPGLFFKNCSGDEGVKPFGISFSAMQRVKKSLYDSYLVTLSLRRLSFSAIYSLLLLVAGVCCSEDVIWFVSSLTSVHVEACSTKMVGVCSSRFLFEVQLLVSSPCLDLLLKITDWLRLVSPVDIIHYILVLPPFHLVQHKMEWR